MFTPIMPPIRSPGSHFNCNRKKLLPDIDLIKDLPEILDGIFVMLSDKKKEIRRQAGQGLRIRVVRGAGVEPELVVRVRTGTVRGEPHRAGFGLAELAAVGLLHKGDCEPKCLCWRVLLECTSATDQIRPRDDVPVPDVDPPRPVSDNSQRSAVSSLTCAFAKPTCAKTI